MTTLPWARFAICVIELGEGQKSRVTQIRQLNFSNLAHQIDTPLIKIFTSGEYFDHLQLNGKL